MRHARALVVGVILALGLAGCVGSGTGDATGAWVHESGALIEIRSDGTMTYTDIPAEIASSADAVQGDGCQDAIAQSDDLRSGEGEWSDEDDFYYLYFEDGAVQAYAGGFPAFDRLEIRCDVESGGAYRFDRQ